MPQRRAQYETIGMVMLVEAVITTGLSWTLIFWRKWDQIGHTLAFLGGALGVGAILCFLAGARRGRTQPSQPDERERIEWWGRLE